MIVKIIELSQNFNMA